MLECDDASYYTGYTKNMVRRYRQHVEGKAGVKYTRTHKPVRIAQCWRLFGTVGTALKVELYIKRRPRSVKDRFVSNPAELKPGASRAIEQDLNIFTVDPEMVEREALAIEMEDLKNGADPFAGAPPADLYAPAASKRAANRRPSVEGHESK
jgi:putative endonuclease